MLDVNPRTLRRLDIDTVCLRQVEQQDRSVRMVACTPSVFVDAQWTWHNVVFFEEFYRILPIVEYAVPEPHPRRHLVMEVGWSEEIVDAMREECPHIRKTVSAKRAVVEMLTSRGERILVPNEACTGCN